MSAENSCSTLGPTGTLRDIPPPFHFSATLIKAVHSFVPPPAATTRPPTTTTTATTLGSRRPADYTQKCTQEEREAKVYPH